MKNVVKYRSLNLFSFSKVDSELSHPADTRRKLNVHKTLIRRQGGLLNGICTFNLRLLSTEQTSEYACFYGAKSNKIVS